MLAAAALGLGCSVLTEPERQQCRTDADCVALGMTSGASDLTCVDEVCQASPAWACLGAGSWPAPAPGMAVVTISIRGLVDDLPVTTATAQLCRRLDFACSEPLTPPVAPDPEGRFTLDVETGFDGYVELRAPGHVPGLYSFYPHVSGDRDIPALPLVRPAELLQFAELGGHPVKEGRGHVMLGAYDCQNQSAAGVRLSSTDADEITSSFYLVGRLPSLSAPATDASGRGGLINVRPGPAIIIGSLGDGRKTATNSVVVREGTITYTSLLPAPR